MQAVIIASQKNYYLGKNAPDSMALIDGRPKLEHLVENLPQKTRQIIFILGYRGDAVRQHFGNYWRGLEVRYLWQYRLTDNAQDILYRSRRMFQSEEILIIDSETNE